MNFPDLERLLEWMGKDTIEEIDAERRSCGKVRREGKFSNCGRSTVATRVVMA